MKKMRWIRAVALGLALVLLVGMVGALSYDRNGDGKTNIWDLQLMLNSGEAAQERAAGLQEALGGGDELHKNADGKWEIWSAMGLYNMAKNAKKGDTFLLMTDIDLEGAVWTPVVFHGTFEGQGHTISNVTITESVYIKGSYDMGFFAQIDLYQEGETQVRSQIRDLHLQNVTITVDRAEVAFIGLLVGSNRGGIVSGCTTTGIITDERTTLTRAVYIGTLVGRNNDSTPAGEVVRGTDLLVGGAGTENPEDRVEGLTSIAALQLTELTYPEGTDAKQKYKRTTGVVGYSKVPCTDLLWQDASNSTELLSATEQQCRAIVEDTMRQMGTVKWTPSETITFTKNNNPASLHSNAFIAGETYTGIPYVGGYNGNMDRFLSQMQPEKDAEGRYVTVTGLENGERIAGGNEDGTTKTTGFILYMGNNCSVAVGWAWAAITPARVHNDDGKIYGGAAVRSAYYMVPNDYNTTTYGTLPVGDYQLLETDTERYNQAIDARDTQTIIALNGGAEGMAEYYALAHKGDAITYAEYTKDAASGDYSYEGSHIRLLSADPVIIRNYKNEIDLERSYVLTHEQGDGLNDNDGTKYGKYTVKYTSWRIDHKYTLSVLLTEEGYAASKAAGEKPGCGWGYVPVTMRAFTGNGPDKKPYYAEYPSHPISLPNTGWYYSNYWNISGTMKITDADGQVIYDETKLLMNRNLSTQFDDIKLEKDFPDADDNLVAGQTYRITLSFKASNGKVTTVKNNEEFVYTPIAPPADTPTEPNEEENLD